MPRAIDAMIGGGGPGAGKHVDAYMEYSQLVGRLDGGRMLPEAVYEELRRKAANPARRLYVNWRNASGLDCKAIGPQSMCLCQHRYNEHDWDSFEQRRVRCKMPGCSCTCFSYIPIRGAQDLKCSACHTSYTEHRPSDHGCPRGGTTFTSAMTCSCTQTYQQHRTVFESREERERDGRPVDAGWMEQAAREGLPVCHLGGILGFTSLADGVDRAMAGLEGPAFAEAAVAGGAVGDAGANRWMQRMELEDEVNTASALHGRVAGQRTLADVQARQRQQRALPGPGVGSARGSGTSGSSRSVSAGPSGGARPGSGQQQQPRANIHTLNDRPSLGSGAAEPPRRPPKAGSASKAAGTAGQRRSASAAPAAVGTTLVAAGAGAVAGTGVGGRRVGGVRKSDPEAMRQARLAKFEG